MSDWVRIDLDTAVYWPVCQAPDCKGRICIGASDMFCYPHTLEQLIGDQIEAINTEGSNDERAIIWTRSARWEYNDVGQNEAALMELANMEINYAGKAWLKSALEIIRRIRIKDDE